VQLSELKTALAEVIDFDADTIRFYNLGSKWESKISTMGNDKGFKQDETLII
jgi:CRISPR/Cas system-associated endoribonuclease Cas2